MCDNHGVINKTINGTQQCMFINDTKNKLHLIKPCTNPAKPICDYSAIASGSPAYCVADTTPVELTLPGEYCSKNAHCLSNSCRGGVCKGRALNALCDSDKQCDVGMFCSKTYGVCTAQQLFGSNCTRDNECTNNCACNKQKCVYYYSFDNFLEADNPLACESGYVKDGKCYPALVSRYKGRTCATDDDCEAYNYKRELVQYGECQCGYNGGGFTYCTLAEGDPEFQQMKDKFAFIVARGFYCHTSLRFGPCKELYDDEYRDYQVAIRYFKQYPQLVFNDACIKSTINSEFWDFLGAGKIEVHTLLLALIAAVLYLL